MDTHKNASLTPEGREAMARSVIEGGLSKAAAARQFNTTSNTVAKWVDRFRADGVAGLQDRSSRPRTSPSQAAPAICARVEALRRQRLRPAILRKPPDKQLSDGPAWRERRIIS
jgi:transposase-like protein